MNTDARSTLTLGFTSEEIKRILVAHAEAAGIVFPGVAADATASIELVAESVRRTELESSPLLNLRLDWKL